MPTSVMTEQKTEGERCVQSPTDDQDTVPLLPQQETGYVDTTTGHHQDGGTIDPSIGHDVNGSMTGDGHGDDPTDGGLSANKDVDDTPAVSKRDGNGHADHSPKLDISLSKDEPCSSGCDRRASEEKENVNGKCEDKSAHSGPKEDHNSSRLSFIRFGKFWSLRRNWKICFFFFCLCLLPGQAEAAVIYSCVSQDTYDATVVHEDVRCIAISSEGVNEIPSNLCPYFPKVTEVHLIGNHLEEIPERLLRCFPKLFHVVLDNNSISSLTGADSSLRYTVVVKLRNNSFVDIPDDLTTILPWLKIALFDHNQVTDIPILSNLVSANFSILNLVFNQLVKLHLDQFNKPSVVHNLTLSDDKIVVTFHNGRTFEVEITGNEETLLCEENKFDFDPSIQVDGSITCRYRNGTQGVVVLRAPNPLVDPVTNPSNLTASVEGSHASHLQPCAPVVILVCFVTYLASIFKPY